MRDLRLRRERPDAAATVPDVRWAGVGRRTHVRSRTVEPVAPDYTSAVAQPLRTGAEHEAPPIDPAAVDKAYRVERARRRVRDERRRASRRANRRFWVIMLLLVVACVVLALTVWHEVERLFGI